MTLLEEVLSEYLSKEDLQRIAREHDLPVSRTKEEIVGELLALDDFQPEEAVAFMGVPQLRYFCQEHGLPSGAYREALAERVLTAIDEEENPPPKPRRRSQNGPPAPTKVTSRAPMPPSTDSAPASPPKVQVRYESSEAKPIDVVVPAPPPPQIRLNVQQPQAAPIEIQVRPAPPPSVLVRTPPPQMAGWGFVGVVAAAIFGGIYFVTTATLGTSWGVAVGIVSGIVAATALLLTEGRWAPKLNRLIGGRSPPPP
jgi:hypothetical protein